MVPISGKPVLAHQVEWLKANGVNTLWLIVNHQKEIIQDYFGDGTNWGVAIRYYEETEPLGTVGGIKAIENELPNNFLVVYGDVMVNMALDRLQNFHRQHDADATLVLHPNDHPFDSDLVELSKANRITAFHPKPRPEGRWYQNMVNAGVYLLSKKILTFATHGVKADFGKDIFPKAVEQFKVMGYNTSEYLKDMGTPGRLAHVQADFQSGLIAARNLNLKQKAIFLDRDGVLNEDTDLVATPEELQMYTFAGAEVRKINQSGYLAIVITNQSVVARNLCTEAGLRLIHNKMETILGEAHAKLDAIYYCPHHPHGGFPEENPAYKIDCHCRKPKPGMLLDAARDFNIDLSASWFIGDTERDIVAAKAAGVKSIRVKTGRGHEPSKVEPDFVAVDLPGAVRLILG